MAGKEAGPAEAVIERHDDAGPLRPHPRPCLTLDYKLYEPFLEDEDISEEDKRQFLEALWTIIVGFVDLGFEVRPEDSENSCGKDSYADFPNTVSLPDSVKSKTLNPAKVFEEKARPGAKAEGISS